MNPTKVEFYKGKEKRRFIATRCKGKPIKVSFYDKKDNKITFKNMKKKQSLKSKIASLRNLEVNEMRQRVFWIIVGAIAVMVGFFVGKIL